MLAIVVIIGVACFSVGVLFGAMLTAIMSIDRVNRELKGNTYE